MRLPFVEIGCLKESEEEKNNDILSDYIQNHVTEHELKSINALTYIRKNEKDFCHSIVVQ
jgi:hypothetical protein